MPCLLFYFSYIILYRYWRDGGVRPLCPVCYFILIILFYIDIGEMGCEAVMPSVCYFILVILFYIDIGEMGV